MVSRPNHKILAATGLFLCLSISTWAQERPDPEITLLIEQIAEDAGDEIDYTDLHYWLNYYYENPLNLNLADATALNQLYILNPLQVQSLLTHRATFGRLLSIYELQAVPHFDLTTIARIRPFVSVGGEGNAVSLRTCFTEGKHEMLGRVSATAEAESGYTDDNPRYRFQGQPYGLQVRYGYRYGSRLSYGLTAEKDAGERFFSGPQKYGFDFYSAHAFYRDEKHLKALAIGDYQVQLGQGLVAWSALGFGKASDVLQTARIARGIIPSRSANEAQFFRGAGGSFQFGSFQFTVFGSRRKIDGNVSDDSLGGISSVLLTGYHRNDAEMEDRRILEESAAGGEVKYEKRNLAVGVSGIFNRYSRPIGAAATYYEPGKAQLQNTAAGVHYSFIWRNAYFFGEAAHAIGRGSAVLQGLLLSLDPGLDLSVFYRKYGRDYFSPYGNAVGEGTRNSNEEGIYAGIAYRLTSKWLARAYADIFRFPWLRYRVGAPSDGYDYLGQLEYRPGKTLHAYIRYRHEVKDLNLSPSGEKTYDPRPAKNERLRFQWQKALAPAFTIRSRAELSWYRHAANPAEKGFLAFQDIEYAFRAFPLKLSARYTFFDIGGYNARIYTYEDDVRYSFSIPSFQDQGTRYYLLAQYKPGHRLTASARIARTQVYNKETIGSGLNEIPVPHRTEIRIQVLYAFDMR